VLKSIVLAFEHSALATAVVFAEGELLVTLSGKAGKPPRCGGADPPREACHGQIGAYPEQAHRLARSILGRRKE
jgi:hypothetical protein